jgi:undecaprenyl phosphate N,N'-diacetylbacillosamine 1-phosphate transferase
MYVRIFKRVIDIIISLVLLIIVSPLLIITTLLLTIANKGSAFFIQKRPGLNESIFKIIKFKTMTDSRDDLGNLLSDEARITIVGKLIRKTSLDELPQLFNVLKGEMSLIGPRPLLVAYLSHYNKFQKQRHDVKPGITGWAQVNGRNMLSWEEKFEHDVWYTKNISFRLDIKILILTFEKVLKRDGISSTSSATMEVFRGSKN